jgi:hypothetical protein
MTTDNHLITKIDLDEQHRHTLAKVYELLLKLAETAEHEPEPLASSDIQENETLKDNIPP